MKLAPEAVTRISQQFGKADLGDPRRSARLARVAGKMAEAPGASIPLALGTDAEVQGAYRLMNNRRVTFDATLEPHIEAAIESARGAREVLLVHDTTECSFPHLDPEEIGYLQTGKAGFRLHYTLAVDADVWRRPLGVVHAETQFRAHRRRRKRGSSGADTANQADSEFARWGRGLKSSGDRLTGCPRVIHVADRESDSYDLMSQALGAKQDFIFRVRVDRRSKDASAESGSTWSTVKAVAAGCEGMLTREVELTRRKSKNPPRANKAHPPRKKRNATLRFAATRVHIPRPQYLRDPVPQTLTLNLVHVVEIDVPSGEPPVEWLLYTTLPIDLPEQVADIVDKYRTRWVIEEFNAALKTGCAYEDRQFETVEALLVMLAISLPIACELLWLRSRARTDPDAPATNVLTSLQIRVLIALGTRKLSAAPTVQEALLAVAGLGGHLKRNGPPGWLVLYRGMQKLKTFETGWAAADAAAGRTSDL
jgi:hypothetical protein